MQTELMMEPLPERLSRPALSDRALDIRRGAWMLLRDLGYAAHTEVRLKTARNAQARRADLMAINRAGEIIIVEVKSGAADFQSDHKWHDYMGYCDRFYFAVDEDFPRALLEEASAQPATCGLIIADRWSGAMIRPAAKLNLAASRRKKLMIELAMSGGRRKPACASETDP